MPNAILSVILGSVLVLSLISITNVRDANAKILPNSELPVDIDLFDRNGKRVEADGSIRIADQVNSNVSFVIPQQEYRLKMHIGNSPNTKIFSMYYIVKISEYESGYTSQIKWEEVTVNPSMQSQEFDIPLQFEEDMYKIEVFLWNDLDNPNVVIARPFVSNQIIKAVTIERTSERYGEESNYTLLNSTHEYLNHHFTEVITHELIMNPLGSLGGNWAQFQFQDEFSLIVSSEQPVYGDIVYYGGDPREWLIVKQNLSKEFRIDVQIPEEQALFDYKWGVYVLNPNDEPVKAHVTTVTTNHSYLLEDGKSESSISLVSPESVSLNDVIALEGKIDPPHSANISVVMYTIGHEVIKLTTNTSAVGEYKILFKADIAGRWEARAVWEGDEDHLGAISEYVTFDVEMI